MLVKNTNTQDDIEQFQAAGVHGLMTTTPLLDGRLFGTNMMEAALIAASGRGRPPSCTELSEIIEQLNFKPKIQELNEWMPS